MKRAMKNGILFAAMAVAVGMLTLTLLHGYGVIGGKGAVGAPVGRIPGVGPNDSEGFGRPDGNNGENAGADGEEIGEVPLPDGGNENNPGAAGGMDGMGAPGESLGADGMPQKPDGEKFGGRQAAGNDLGAHLAFATVWVFLFAFCLSWAIYSRCNSEQAGRKGGDGQWKSEPASSGTN